VVARKELSGGTEVPPLKDSSLPLSRARCEPGLARWVPRRPPAPSAPRVERMLPLHWCWFYIEDPGHEQARGTWMLLAAQGVAVPFPSECAERPHRQGRCGPQAASPATPQL
jgi:hypothetical protein